MHLPMANILNLFLKQQIVVIMMLKFFHVKLIEKLLLLIKILNIIY